MTRTLLTFLIAICLLSTAARSQTSALSRLSPEDRTTFENIASAVRNWDGSIWLYEDIKSDIQRLSLAYPDFVPLEIERHVLEWGKLSDWQGVRTGSLSILPRLLYYAQQAPDYPKSHLMAARAYIFAQDYEGAKPSLNKATQLDPKNPWVDLTWSLLHERKFNHELAINSARKALEKSDGEHAVIAKAIILIAKNHGIQDLATANAMAKGVASLQPNPEIQIKIAEELIDSYYFQPGLLETPGAILDQANSGSEPTPASLLQWAKLTMKTGYISSKGPREIYDENYLESAKKMLKYVQRISDLDLDVQPYLLEIAISEQKFDEAKDIIEYSSRIGATKTWTSWANAQIMFAKRKYVDVLSLYNDNKLSPRDYAFVEAFTSNSIGATKQKYLHYIEWEPTIPQPYGNYATYLLYTLKDADSAILLAREAMKIGPYPAVEMTLATALLYQSGMLLRDGHLNDALESYGDAKAVGFKEDVILQQCYALCAEITAAITAFR